MDPGAHRLDYALFQLTPTRTRCDLVIFYGGKSEKLASGLFQPFISHLKSVKDEISRGGYSITVRPPNPYAPWFTKSTFQRFVRFVSTPAVLERFVSIEKEILQIESSVQLEEGAANLSTRKSTGSLQKRGELEEADEVVEDENSKVKLQRLLETRVAFLRKQQAMAYARGLVAGFDIYNMDDLISFSDAFGASRLREASINFKELYMKKHQDGLWIQEVAAVVASSSSDLQLKDAAGITLTNESDATNQNGGLPAQAPMPLPNQNPQYFYSSLGHANQMPPYTGYPFPTMQSFPPHYPRNLQWPPNMDEASFGKEPNYHRVQKLSSRRKKREDKQIELSDSTSGSDTDSDTQQDRKHSDLENSSKKNRKKSSRKVIIKNINYITPKRRDGNKGAVSDESCSDEEIDGGHSLRQKSEKAEELLEISHEANSPERNDFGSLRMRDEKLKVNDVVPNHVQDENFILRSEGRDSLTARTNLELNFEKIPKQLAAGATADPLVMMNGNRRTDDGVELEGFQKELFRSVMERKDCADQDILFLQRSEESGTGTGFSHSAGAAESTIIKNSREEDWFVVNHFENAEDRKVPIKQADYDGDRIFSSEGKGVGVDDSFFIQNRSEVDDMYVSPWKTEIGMNNDLSLSSQKENGIDTHQNKYGKPNTSEPEDLYMVLERNSNSDSAAVSWSMDYGAEISFPEANRRLSGAETTDAEVDHKLASKNSNVKSNKVPGTKDGGKEARSNLVRRALVNNRSDIKSKKAPLSRPIIQKSKLEKEEEIRKKMEELRIERQKRIAEKTAAGGFSPVAPRRVASDSKATQGSIKSDNSKLQSTRRTLHL